MSNHLPHRSAEADSAPDLARATDEQLLALVRTGHKDAYGELFRRHHQAVLRYAQNYVRSRDVAYDLVAESFTRVLQAILGGAGPSTSFLGYLLTTLRHTAGDWGRSAAQTYPVADMTEVDHETAPPASQGALALFERSAVARAFLSLPERWRMVLWHTEVYGVEPAKLAQRLGLSPNAVSALAYRAREGLRQAYLNQHVTVGHKGCRKYIERFGAHARGQLRPEAKQEQLRHIRECPLCRSKYREVCQVERMFRATSGPALLALVAVPGCTWLRAATHAQRVIHSLLPQSGHGAALLGCAPLGRLAVLVPHMGAECVVLAAIVMATRRISFRGALPRLRRSRFWYGDR